MPDTDWTEARLGEVASFQNGYPFKPSELTGEGLPVVRIKQLLDPTAEMDRSDEAVPERFRLRDGDLVFSWSGTLAVRMWDRGDAWLNQHLFRVVEQAGVQRPWLRLALEHAIEALAAKTHGTTMKHVTKGVLESHLVLLPPWEEQARIAEVVSVVDAQIEALESETDAAGRVVAALRGVAPPGDDVVLGDLLMGIDSGRSVRTEGEPSIAGEPRILKVSAVKSGNFDAEEAKRLPDTTGFTLRSLVGEGDLLMTRSNTPDRVGFCAVARGVPPATYMPDLIWRLRLDESRCLPGFLEHRLASDEMRSRVTATASGTSASMRKINKRGISAVRLTLPTVDDQAAYVEKCEAAARTVAALRTEVGTLRTFRDTLVTSLLSQSVMLPESYDHLEEVAS